MSPEKLAELRAHMRADEEPDSVILSYWEAAVEYLENMGVTATTTGLCWLAVRGLCLEWYDGGAMCVPAVAVGLQGILQQLKMTAVGNGGPL